METDSLFYRLFKELPQTLFELIGQPARLARAYRFDSVEVKKSLRIDGLFLPKKSDLPLVVVEVQFRLLAAFYANLFAKVFCYLEENDPDQDWLAVAIFGSRSMEPKHLTPYQELLQSARVKRIYLDEYEMPADPPPGLGILQLVTAPQDRLERLVTVLRRRVEMDLAATDLGHTVVELLEEVLIRRFSRLSREEVRTMFQLEDLRKTKVWQEAHEEGLAKGKEKGLAEGKEKGLAEGVRQGKTLATREMVRKCLAKSMPAKAIAQLLDISVQEVRRLAKTTEK